MQVISDIVGTGFNKVSTDASVGGGGSCLSVIAGGCIGLAGCLTGVTIGNYLRGKKEQATLEALYGYKQEDDEEEKQKKREEFWGKYDIFKKTDNNKDNNNITMNKNGLLKINDKNNNQFGKKKISDEEKKIFIENPDVYGQGFEGWYNFLCCKGPQYVIEKKQEAIENDNNNNKSINESANMPFKGIEINIDNIVAWMKKNNNDEGVGVLIQQLIEDEEYNFDAIFKQITNNDDMLIKLFTYLKMYWNKKEVPDEVFSFFLGILDKLSKQQWLLLFGIGKEQQSGEYQISNNNEEENINNNNDLLRLLLSLLTKQKNNPELNPLRKKLWSFFIKSGPMILQKMEGEGENDISNNNNLLNDDKNDKSNEIEMFFLLMEECSPALTAEGIDSNIKTIEIFFNILKQQYKNVNENGKMVILKFATNILKNIDDSNDKNYELLLSFILGMLKDNKDLLNSVLENEQLRVNIFKVIMENYNITERLKNLGQSEENIESKNNDNGFRLTENLRMFVVEFFKKYNIPIQEYKNDDDLMLDLLRQLLGKVKNNELKKATDILELIIAIANKSRNNKEYVQLIINHLNDASEDDMKSIVNGVDCNKCLQLLFLIFDDVEKDQKNNEKQQKYQEDVYKNIFSKMVNQGNIDILIDIILKNEELKNKILKNENLKMLFLQQFINEPKLIIENIVDVKFDENEIVDSKNDLNNKNNINNIKKPKQGLVNFFLNLLNSAYDKLFGEDVLKILQAILEKYQVMNDKKTLTFAGVWSLLDALLKKQNTHNMPEDFWNLITEILKQESILIKNDNNRITKHLIDFITTLKMSIKGKKAGEIPQDLKDIFNTKFSHLMTEKQNFMIPKKKEKPEMRDNGVNANINPWNINNYNNHNNKTIQISPRHDNQQKKENNNLNKKDNYINTHPQTDISTKGGRRGRDIYQMRSDGVSNSIGAFSISTTYKNAINNQKRNKMIIGKKGNHQQLNIEDGKSFEIDVLNTKDEIPMSINPNIKPKTGYRNYYIKHDSKDINNNRSSLDPSNLCKKNRQQGYGTTNIFTGLPNNYN